MIVVTGFHMNQERRSGMNDSEFSKITKEMC